MKSYLPNMYRKPIHKAFGSPKVKAAPGYSPFPTQKQTIDGMNKKARAQRNRQAGHISYQYTDAHKSVHTGPRGGRYYVSKNGTKVYV